MSTSRKDARKEVKSHQELCKTKSLPLPKVPGFHLTLQIGKGTYGTVYRATKVGKGHEVVAIKCIPVVKLSAASRDNIINEISILKQLSHPFIVQMLDFRWDPTYVYLVLEHCPGGELATVIRLKRQFPEDIVRHFLQQLASALQYLRGHNVAHMDLKPQNILITGVAFVNLLHGLASFQIWRNVILKIADFGFAQYLTNEDSATSRRGSPLYMAPEILLGHEYDARVDLWSIGCILYECLFGHAPFHGKNTPEIIATLRQSSSKFSQINIPEGSHLSENCRDLLRRLLQVDPGRRLSYEAFFAHGFLDLEYMPSGESYRKAVEILRQAADSEKDLAYKTAFYKYREALLYLMPLYQWGVTGRPVSRLKQDQLKAMITSYMERAELLKHKCDILELDPSRLAQIETIYNLIDSAREFSSKALWEEALEKYEMAIGAALKLVKEADPRVRTEFFGEITVWMDEAEEAKSMYEGGGTSNSKEVRSNSVKEKKSSNEEFVEGRSKAGSSLKESKTGSSSSSSSSKSRSSRSKLKYLDQRPCRYDPNDPKEPNCSVQ